MNEAQRFEALGVLEWLRESKHLVTARPTNGEATDEDAQLFDAHNELADDPEPVGYGAVLVDLADVAIRDVSWLDDGYLPAGELVIVQGHGGAGKGTLACHWAAQVTTGQTPGGPGFVLFVVAEDDYASVLKPRLLAAGADIGKVRAVDFRRGGLEDSLRIPDDVPELQAAIEQTGAKLCWIDPLLSHLSRATDSYRDHDVKLALRPLAKLAGATGCTIGGIHHLTKNTSAGALHSGQASGAFATTARLVLALVKHDEDEQLRVLEVVKSNISEVGLRQAVRLELVPVAGLTKLVPKIVPAGHADKTADELLQAARTPRGAKKADAKDLILRELAGGAKGLDEVKMKAAAEIGASGETVWRAANELKAEKRVECHNSGFGTPWFWRLTSSPTSSYTPTDEVDDSLEEVTTSSVQERDEVSYEVGQGRNTPQPQIELAA